jgi:alpha-glucosidase (family GH31 glycosyl hydrolase)
MWSPEEATMGARSRRSLAVRSACAAFAALLVCGVVAGSAYGVAATSDVSYDDTGGVISLGVPGGSGAPGYTIKIDRDPFAVSTWRGGQRVLATSAGSPPAAEILTAAGWAGTTTVRDAQWQDGVLDLIVDTSQAANPAHVRLTPTADRYQLRLFGAGADAVLSTSVHYAMSTAGHWYGHGEAQTADGGPYTRQPWPLDEAAIRDDVFGPASYLMIDPFWFTQSAAGLWFDTREVMAVSLGSRRADTADFEVQDSDTSTHTVFVEATPHAVYQDYVGITGAPAKSDATPTQYRLPLWNSWAQFYTSVSQDKVLEYANGLHTAGVPGHTIQVDDGWMSHYGDFTFNDKFPAPKQMSDEIHGLGYDMGLWVTLWINNDADNYAYARDHGYLLHSKEDPAQPCQVTWWNGTAGIVDLANPDARAWFGQQLRNLESTYGVDGFKFDTRFFDERCAPYPGHQPLDYLDLGARLADEFDQQGAGIRIHWTGSQRYGFVIRQVDKSTDWGSLQAAVAQNLAISSIGYPFVETDMIGGSLGGPTPSKQLLIRWAQAASLMPLMYSSTSPVGRTDPFTGQREDYDQETVDLYTRAVQRHEQLTPYIRDQVRRAIATGEPIMKPLFFQFPGDAATYSVDDQWLLGDSLLAAPLVTDAQSRNVHIPPGRWYDATRSRVVVGPSTLTGYRAGLGETPVFVRLGRPDTGDLLSIVAGW